MCLTSSDIIGIVGIGVSVGVTISLFIIVNIINRVKGPRLSVFGYREEDIKSKILLEHSDASRIDADLLPKPRWFIVVPFEMLNIGDTYAKFNFHAILELQDLIDTKTNEPMKAYDTNGISKVLEPGIYYEELPKFFGFIFEDVGAFEWIKATITIKGHYFDHRSNKKEIKIDPQILINPNPINKLDQYTMNSIADYALQQKKLQSKI